MPNGAERFPDSLLVLTGNIALKLDTVLESEQYIVAGAKFTTAGIFRT